jgi:hypothetical protein
MEKCIWANTDIWAVIISILALSVSIRTLRRDRSNREFDMLTQSLSAIHELNRCILKTMDKDIQSKAFLREMQNHYELLAFFVNRNQINLEHVASVEKDFIFSFYDKVKSEFDQAEYPEFYQLVDRLKNPKGKSVWRKLNTPIIFYYKD